MAKRITIMIDEDTHKKAKNLQAKMIPKSEFNVSFSYVLNLLMEEGLKKFK